MGYYKVIYEVISSERGREKAFRTLESMVMPRRAYNAAKQAAHFLDIDVPRDLASLFPIWGELIEGIAATIKNMTSNPKYSSRRLEVILRDLKKGFFEDVHNDERAQEIKPAYVLEVIEKLNSSHFDLITLTEHIVDFHEDLFDNETTYAWPAEYMRGCTVLIDVLDETVEAMRISLLRAIREGDFNSESLEAYRDSFRKFIPDLKQALVLYPELVGDPEVAEIYRRVEEELHPAILSLIEESIVMTDLVSS